VTTLKKQMHEDLAAFFNSEEFGDELLIDGEPHLGVWGEENEEPVRQFFGSGMDNVPGVFTVHRVLFVARLDGSLMETPVPEQELDIDGLTWTVQDAVHDEGVIKLVLFRNET
jgi:hypothetical protein